MTSGAPGTRVTNNAYRIETSRLVVRCYQPTDATLLAESVSESLEYLRPWLPWAHNEPQPLSATIQTLHEFRGNFDLHKDYTYGIFNREETKLLGGTGLHTRLAGDREFEIGYWIHQHFVGQGLATEAASSVVKVAFRVLEGVHRLEIRNDVRNIPSAAIARKLDFTHEGTLRSKYDFLGDWKDLMVWGLLQEEYPDSRSSSLPIKVYDACGNVLYDDLS